jgi:hypothetical protein
MSETNGKPAALLRRATMDVPPEMLQAAMFALPSAVKIVGSGQCEGYVRLILQGPNLPASRLAIMGQEANLQKQFTIVPDGPLTRPGIVVS